jgi:hypothetical protein
MLTAVHLFLHSIFLSKEMDKTQLDLQARTGLLLMKKYVPNSNIL